MYIKISYNTALKYENKCFPFKHEQFFTEKQIHLYKTWNLMKEKYTYDHRDVFFINVRDLTKLHRLFYV